MVSGAELNAGAYSVSLFRAGASAISLAPNYFICQSALILPAFFRAVAAARRLRAETNISVFASAFSFPAPGQDLGISAMAGPVPGGEGISIFIGNS